MILILANIDSQHTSCYNGLQMFTHENNMYNIDFDEQFTLFSLLYADDTIIFAESEKQLQAVLDAVH